MNSKIKLGLVVFLLGLIGVLSIMASEIPLPPEAEALLNERFTPFQTKLLILVNPAIMLLIATVVGTVLIRKVGLDAPFVSGFIDSENPSTRLYPIFKSGVSGGLLAGIALTLVTFVFVPNLPQEFKELGEGFKPSLITRFLYGGLTEEILMRFGLMTFIVWLLSFIFKNKMSWAYWLAIGISSILFAAGHFPVAFAALDEPSTLLLTYILLANSLGGLVFGWLYWKKGLEAAMIAHIFTHVVLVIFEPMIS